MAISSIITVKGLTENFEEDTSFSGLINLEILNLSFTGVTDGGLSFSIPSYRVIKSHPFDGGGGYRQESAGQRMVGGAIH